MQNKLAEAEAEKKKLAEELNELKAPLVEWKMKFLKVEAENYKLAEGLASERLELSLERQNTEKLKSQSNT